MKRVLPVWFLIAAACTQAEEAAAPPGESESVLNAPSQPAENPSAQAMKLLDEDAFKKAHALKEEEAPAPRGEMIQLGEARAYLSLPEGAGPHPGVVVIHEWWGLNRNIKYWSDRLAELGYAALAVDLYGGKVATDADTASKYMKSVQQDQATPILVAAHDFLRNDSRTRSAKVGALGWCFGGGQALQLALAEPELEAAVMYYGFPVTDAKALRQVDADVLAFFGSEDDFIPVTQVKEFEKALKKADVDHEVHIYDGATHAFANPSNAHYDLEKAEQAFEQTRAFLASHLRESPDSDP